MAQSVRLSDELVQDARIHSEAEDRSIPKQIERWSRVGKTMIDNPDLTYEVVEEATLATAEVRHGKVKPYRRRTKR